ncbi:DciA family protein [Streptomyces griseoflavus]|uniref:DciA family protein n=1 Tax=Streptomyces griseoflavus TaxID=35619 RepID=UPI003D7502B9
MGAALTERVNEVLAPRTEIAGVVVQAASGAVPRIVQDRWPDIVGEDLADQVEPVMLALQGQELCTVAVSAAARYEAARCAPEILARIRELVGEQCAITRWPPSSLLPVVVLVTGSASSEEQCGQGGSGECGVTQRGLPGEGGVPGPGVRAGREGLGPVCQMISAKLQRPSLKEEHGYRTGTALGAARAKEGVS